MELTFVELAKLSERARAEYYRALANAEPDNPTLHFLAQHSEEWADLVEVDGAAQAQGTLVGRYYTEPVADGYAYYQVRTIRKRTIVLEHVPIGDAYQSLWVERLKGKVPREVVEANINTRDRMAKLFGSRSKDEEVTA